jgi:hypothetical protein
MNRFLFCSLVALLAPACGAAPVDPSSDETPLTVTLVHLNQGGTPDIEVLTETAAERALRTGAIADHTTGAHTDAISVWGGGVHGLGPSACSSYAQSLALELCDNSSANCGTGNLACIIGSPQDPMISLTSVPRGYVALCRFGQCPPVGNFYQHVVQYRANAFGPVFEKRIGWITTCSETSIDGGGWTSSGSCAASQANLIGINCLGSGSTNVGVSCTADSDCCRIGAWCDNGTCVGNGF